MTKFESDPSKLVVNDVDLSWYVDHIKPMSQLGDDEPNLRLNLAGLKGFSQVITFDNALTGEEIAELEERFRAGRSDYRWAHVAPLTPVKYETPDGRWQAFKYRLKFGLRFWPFRLLKVRYVTYSFDVALSSDGLTSVTGTAVSPVTKGIETR